MPGFSVAEAVLRSGAISRGNPDADQAKTRIQQHRPPCHATRGRTIVADHAGGGEAILDNDSHGVEPFSRTLLQSARHAAGVKAKTPDNAGGFAIPPFYFDARGPVPARAHRNRAAPAGTRNPPSGSWWFSMIASSVRPTATAVPLRVWTGCGEPPPAGRKRAAQAARLVVGRVRRRRQLPVALLARQPRLAVVLLRRGRAQVAGGDVHDAVRDLEVLQDLLLDREQPLVLLSRGRGLDEREHLHLVELVHAEDAARVLAGGARLAPEAGREARVAQGQIVRRPGSGPRGGRRGSPRRCPRGSRSSPATS